MRYEIKEFYDVDRFYEYMKMCSPLFRVPMKKLNNRREFEEIFNGYPDDPDYIRLGAYDNGKLYGGAQFPWFDVNYDGNVIKMYGAGGVASDFNQPYKGAMKQIFKRAFELMRERGAYISHIFPFSDNYYRQFGYEVSCEKAVWEIPVNAFRRYDDGCFVPFDNSEKMRNEIKDIYASFAVQRNMSVVRSEKDWDKFFEENKAYAGNMYGFVSYTDEGADGYMKFSIVENENVPFDFNVESLYFKTYKGLRALLSYFSTQVAYANKVILNLCSDVDISPLIDSRIGNKHKWTYRKVSNWGVTRIVCVDEMLKLSCYSGEGRAVIKIVNDTYCPWNNGVYTVSFGEKNTVTEGGEPDIEMDINAFSSGITGRADVDALEIFPTVKIFGNRENLRKIFYKKAGWMEEHY